MLFWNGLECNSDEVNVKSGLIAHLPETTSSGCASVRREFKHNWETRERREQRAGWRLGIAAAPPPRVTFSAHAEAFDHGPAQG